MAEERFENTPAERAEPVGTPARESAPNDLPDPRSAGGSPSDGEAEGSCHVEDDHSNFGKIEETPSENGNSDNTDPGRESGNAAPPETDYAALAESDLKTLREVFPGCHGLRDLRELSDPIRYAELRDLGLSPEEAFLATERSRTVPSDNRRHLHASQPKYASAPTGMTSDEFSAARELFEGLSDAEIHSLYRRAAGK